jgi:SAM-dependent methyltransferase
MPVEDRTWACRACSATVVGSILDLGAQPSADDLLDPDSEPGAEPVARLAIGVCRSCWLVQLIPTDRAPGVSHGHGTAFSPSTLDHLGNWADETIREMGLQASSLVVDVAAGSGHLLAPFRTAGIPVLAIESDPASAQACRSAGIPTTLGVIGTRVADSIVGEGRADIVLVNHALAHIDDLADAVAGISRILAPHGTVTIEFHHVLGVVAEGQFDAVCHAHRNYLSLTALRSLLARHGLTAIDAHKLPAHGGTVRLLAVPASHAGARATPEGGRRVEAILADERSARLDRPGGFKQLGATAAATFARVRSFLEQAHSDGLVVVGYGAPSRAATLCNVAGITPRLLAFTVDRSPDKQGKLLPGCRIPILDPGVIETARPDVVLILPWTLREEIVAQLDVVRTWGGRFAVALPELQLFA